MSVIHPLELEHRRMWSPEQYRAVKRVARDEGMTVSDCIVAEHKRRGVPAKVGVIEDEYTADLAACVLAAARQTGRS